MKKQCLKGGKFKKQHKPKKNPEKVKANSDPFLYNLDTLAVRKSCIYPKEAERSLNDNQSHLMCREEIVMPNHLPIDQQDINKERLRKGSFISQVHELKKLSDMKRDLDHIDHPDFLKFNRQFKNQQKQIRPHLLH